MHPKRSRWRMGLLVLLTAYLAAHFVLSRCSMAMVKRDWGISDAYLYLPVRPDVVADHEFPLLYCHMVLKGLFFPIWKLEDVVFGGPTPMSSMPLRNFSK